MGQKWSKRGPKMGPFWWISLLRGYFVTPFNRGKMALWRSQLDRYPDLDPFGPHSGPHLGPYLVPYLVGICRYMVCIVSCRRCLYYIIASILFTTCWDQFITCTEVDTKCTHFRTPKGSQSGPNGVLFLRKHPKKGCFRPLFWSGSDRPRARK